MFLPATDNLTSMDWGMEEAIKDWQEHSHLI